MNEALAEYYGERPRQHLAVEGYAKFDDMEAVEKAGVEVYAPIPAPRDKNRDRYAPRPDDAPWRYRASGCSNHIWRWSTGEFPDLRRPAPASASRR